ncbi:MAG: right-handed parallel beta-helix repeat-containing protein [Rhodanobacteraceae bacterium]|nr:right-handed parallel beta-helix repeat-containing protein [Rhodanobacteraceae bacterium]
MTRTCHLLLTGLLLAPALHAATLTVTSTADSGAGSLRAAIVQANATPAADSIVFNTGGGGARNIALTSALPAISAPVSIDGGTQPGYTNAPLIQIDGRGAGPGVDGLVLSTGASTLRALSIIGFGASGVLIDGAGGNTVTLCHIGLNGSGGAVGNGHSGVYIRSSPDNRIGPGNVISGNAVDGVRIDLAAATGNAVFGNRIGTNSSGTGAIANGYNGVVITAASDNRIGGSTPSDLNLISGNTRNGVGIAGGASGNLVARNYIGLAADGATALGNGEDGVLIVDSPSNLVGGDVTGTYNIIAANGAHGVELRGDGADANTIQRSIIGSDLFGTLDRGNGRAGVYLTPTAGGSGASDNRIGSAAFGAGGNLISGNGWAGVHVEYAIGTQIRGNRIGTDFAGTAALPNAAGGIDIVAAWGTVIGSVDAGNLISGNASSGIDAQFEGLLTVVGNRIGSTADGMMALPNQGRGIWVRDAQSGALIGGADHSAWACDRACNLIVGHSGAGIDLHGLTLGAHQVLGNFIGTRIDGAAALANHTGIQTSVSAQIGGAAAGEGNLVSGNIGHGILASGGSLVALGNRIGSNATGSAAVPNTLDGIHSGSGRVSLAIGDVGAGNLIAGNGDDGVEVDQANGASFPAQVIRANSIGTTPGGACLGNGGHGIYLGNTAFAEIGGMASGSGNRIACNGADGYANPGNASATGVMGNSFYGNGGLAIDVDDDGVSPNDPGDGDPWRDNFPVLVSAVQNGTSARVQGTLDAAANANFRLEFYSDSSCDPSGHGEGRNYLGYIAVGTDANGHAGFSASLPGVVAGQKLTATSTIIIGSEPFIDYNTSEFSACATVAAAPAAPVAGNNGPICARQTLSLTASTVTGASYAWSGPNGFASAQQNPSIAGATVAASGSYSVVATVAGVSSPAASTTATVHDCQIRIADPAPVTEGSGGTTPVAFTVSLSHGSTQALTVAWQTVDGSATAPADYAAGSGTLTIPANATSASITRQVAGDALDEDAETFHVDLSAASAGTLVDNRGSATINDDDAPPALSIDGGGCTVLEGHSGSTPCVNTVRLSAPSGKAISFSVQTADSTAQAGTDYQALGASVRTIAAGATSLALPVQVNGDTLVEADEAFELRLNGVQNASPGSATALGVILNDDNPALIFANGLE